MIVEFLSALLTLIAYMIPGIIWSYVFFPSSYDFCIFGDGILPNGMVNLIERGLVSVGFSLVMIPTITFVLNYFVEVGHSIWTAFFVASLMTGLGFIGLLSPPRRLIKSLIERFIR